MPAAYGIVSEIEVFFFRKSGRKVCKAGQNFHSKRGKKRDKTHPFEKVLKNPFTHLRPFGDLMLVAFKS